MFCQVWDLHLFFFFISFQTVPSGPVSTRSFSTSISLSAVNDSNDNFFPFCPGRERLFIIFNSDLVVNSVSWVSTLFSVAEISSSLHTEQSSMSVVFLNNFFLSLDTFRVNINHRITQCTEYILFLLFSFYNNFTQNVLRCFLCEF